MLVYAVTDTGAFVTEKLFVSCALKNIDSQDIISAEIEGIKEITVEMLASLASLDEQKVRFLQIARDGMVDDTELEDFVQIQKELEQISMAVEALQIWSERMIAEGKIDEKKYRKLMNQ